MEKYMTTQEVSEWIKLKPATIRNLVWKKEFVKNVHYIKPSARKLLFIPEKVEEWLRRDSNTSQKDNLKKRFKSKISI